jgi:hypothetical protein
MQILIADFPDSSLYCSLKIIFRNFLVSMLIVFWKHLKIKEKLCEKRSTSMDLGNLFKWVLAAFEEFFLTQQAAF